MLEDNLEEKVILCDFMWVKLMPFSGLGRES